MRATAVNILEPKKATESGYQSWGRYPGSDSAQHEDKMYRNGGTDSSSQTGEGVKTPPSRRPAALDSVHPPQYILPPAVQGRHHMNDTM